MHVHHGREASLPEHLSSPLEGRLIFVVGAPRSGTNWIQRIVCAYPGAVAVPTETYLFSQGVAPLHERIQHGAAGSFQLTTIYMDRTRYQRAMRHFCDEVFMGLLDVLDPTARYLVERTPGHATCLDEIRDIYPDASVVNIVRDGRDVVRSELNMPWSNLDLREAAVQWRDHVDRARTEGPKFSTYVEVKYEDLLRSPRKEVETLYDALEFDVTPDAVNRALVEARAPYNVDPKMPELSAGKWRETFADDDVAVFMGEAGSTLRSLGYNEEEPIAPASEQSPSETRQAPNGTAARDHFTTRLRSGLRGVRASLRAMTGRQIDPARERARITQRLTNQFLSAAAARDWDKVAELLHPLVTVSVAQQGKERRERGDKGTELLLDVLRDDPALQGRQARADVHPGVPCHSAVLTYRLEDGVLANRALFVESDGASISRVSYYVFPLTP